MNPIQKTNNKTSAGFTLLELMIVVAIVGILVAVALPSYNESVAKSKRADAKAALTSLAGAMERYYTENNTYVGASPTLISPTSSVPIDGGTAYYNLSISNLGVSTYTLTATATGGMNGDRCGNFILTHTGVKTVSTAVTDCW